METKNESLRMEQALQQLALLIHHHAPSNGTHQTAVPSLSLMHATQLSEPLESVYKPSICVVAQGAKTATLADETYRYDPSTYLVTSIELPIIGRIIEASPEIPVSKLEIELRHRCHPGHCERDESPCFSSRGNLSWHNSEPNVYRITRSHCAAYAVAKYA